MKGDLTGVLPMIAVIVLVFIVSIQSLPIAQAFGNELSESVTDLNRISSTKSFGEMFFYSYDTLGSDYAGHNVSIFLGAHGGIRSGQWNEKTVHDSSKIGKGALYRTLSQEAPRYFRSTFQRKRSAGINCEIPELDYDFTYYAGNLGDLKNLVFAGKPISITCDYPEGEINYTSKEDFRATTYAEDNRYFALAYDAIDFFKDLEGDDDASDTEGWEKVQAVTSSSDNVCDPSASDFWKEAKSAAEDINDTVKNEFSAVNSSYPTQPGLVFNRSRIKWYSPSFSIDDEDGNRISKSYDLKYKATASSSSTDVGDCDCHNSHDHDGNGKKEQHCLDDEYDISVTVTPEESKVFWTLQDRKHRIPTPGGWRHLFFRVDYFHDFQDDQP